MDNRPKARRPEWPLNTCQACGGDWFRVAEYYEFWREEYLRSGWPTGPELVGQMSIGPKALLICLCGSPLVPSIGGFRGGHTPNKELSQFMDDCQRVYQLLHEAHNGDSMVRAAGQQQATLEVWNALEERLKRVERQVGRRMRSGPGRPWALPMRQPAAQARDQLVLALEANVGLTSRKAKSVVNAFWNVMQAALRRGEIVETPLGVFQVVAGPKPHQRQRWGKNQVLNRQSRKIIFRTRWDLLAACNPPNSNNPTNPQQEVPVPDVNVPNRNLEPFSMVFPASNSGVRNADRFTLWKPNSGNTGKWRRPCPAGICPRLPKIRSACWYACAGT